MNKKQIAILIVLIALFVPNIFIASSTHRSRGNDFRAFLNGGNRLIEKTYLYEGSGVGSSVTWPPFMMVFIAPWALMAKVNIHITQVIWFLFNASLFFLSVGLWCRIVNKKPFDWFDYKKPLSIYSPLIFLPILFAATPLLDDAVELQINNVQLFLISLGIYYAAAKKDILSGAAFGTATAIKAYPLIFIVFLLARRKFKAATALVATAGLLTLLPVLWYGPHDYIMNIKGWLAISMHGGYPLTGAAQSVYAMLGRWITSDLHTMLFAKVHHPDIHATGSLITIWLYRGLFVSVMGALYGILYFRKYRDIGFEGAAITLIMILFSPISWKHYWVMSFPALFYLWNRELISKDKVINRLLWISFGFITIFQLIGSAYRPFRAFANCVVSNYTLGGLALLAGMLYWASIAPAGKEAIQPDELMKAAPLVT